jgi:hypothetical protein
MREVICADSIDWMNQTEARGAVVTSLPDADECGFDLAYWKEWFVEAAKLSMGLALPNAPAIFYQTDRKSNGELISKSYLCHRAANELGYVCLWDKVVLRRDVGKVDLFRPTYTHLICFSKEGKPGVATPDVMPAGAMIYDNAMGMTAAVMAVKFAGQISPLIIDPFCGRGTIIAVANAYGYKSIGVDILEDQCVKARALQITKP